MTYSVKNSAGTVTYTVADGAANINAISLTFMGKGETNYGTYLNQNFLWLLENFSNNSSNPPAFPVQGQLWWDSTYKFLNVYDGTKWNTVYGNLATLTVNGAVSFSSVSAGTIGNTGAKLTGLITTNAQPYITSVGTLTGLTSAGLSSSATITAPVLGNTGANLIGTINTNAQPYVTSVGTLSSLTASGTTNLQGTTNGATINATNLYATTIGNTGANLIGIINTNAQPYVTSVGTLSSLTASGTTNLQGTTNGATINATNLYATTIGNSGSTYTGSSITLTGNTSIQVNAGSLGTTSGNQLVYATLSSTDGNASNLIFSETRDSAGTSWMTAASRIQNKIDSTWMGFIQFNGTNNNSGITFGTGSSTASATSISERIRIDNSGNFYPAANASYNLGSSTGYWNTIYGVSFVGTSTTAKYADLAEKYLTDSEYPVGTVVMVGGDAEVTQHDGRSVRAVGVVSKHPAYMMNDGLEGGTYIALKGRVPVRVTGPVLKGQSLRGAPWGVAIAEEMSSPYTFAIALETIADPVQTIIEAVIL